MNTETLRTFVLLSKVKNFTDVAEKMYVAQSTVTNRIAELEQEVDKKLFCRNTRGVSLTEEGQIFLSYAQRMLELADASLQEMQNSSQYSRKFRIGTINAVYESRLYPMIKKYMQEQEKISIKVLVGHSLDLLQLLQDNVIDVAFSYVPLKKPGYVCKKFISDHLVLVASPKINQYAKGIKREQLSSIPYLMCNFALSEVGVFIRSLFPKRYAFAFEIDNSTKLIRYVVDGLGYSFLPSDLVKEELKKGELQEIQLLDFSTPKVNSYCVYSQNCGLVNLFLEEKN